MYFILPASADADHFIAVLPVEATAEKLVILSGTIPIVAITQPLEAPGVADAYTRGVLQGTQVKASPVPPPPKVPEMTVLVMILKGVPPYMFTKTPSGHPSSNTPQPLVH